MHVQATRNTMCEMRSIMAVVGWLWLVLGLGLLIIGTAVYHWKLCREKSDVCWCVWDGKRKRWKVENVANLQTMMDTIILRRRLMDGDVGYPFNPQVSFCQKWRTWHTRRQPKTIVWATRGKWECLRVRSSFVRLGTFRVFRTGSRDEQFHNLKKYYSWIT